MAMEEIFDIETSYDEPKNIRTIQDVVDFIVDSIKEKKKKLQTEKRNALRIPKKRPVLIDLESLADRQHD